MIIQKHGNSLNEGYIKICGYITDHGRMVDRIKSKLVCNFVFLDNAVCHQKLKFPTCNLFCFLQSPDFLNQCVRPPFRIIRKSIVINY